MTWRRVATEFGDDGCPVDAATLKDVVRYDINVLLGASPMCIPAHEIRNGAPTVPRTGADAATVDFAHLESVFARFNFFYLRSCLPGGVSNLRVAIWAATSANTGTLRAVWSPSYRMPDDPPVAPSVYDTTGAGAVTATGAWHELEIDIDLSNCSQSRMGGPPLADGGEGLAYKVGYLTLQGMMEAAGTLTISRLAGHEYR